MNLIEPTDADLAEIVRHAVRSVDAGAKSSGSGFCINGRWYVLGIEPSLVQNRPTRG